MAAVTLPRVAVPRVPVPRLAPPRVRPPRVAPRPGTRTNPPVRPVSARPSRTRPSAATFRRRRLAVLVGTVALVPAAHLCAALLGGGPLTAPGEPMRAVAAHVYVVQPGDTLWSIAEQVEPGRDPRPLVQTLSAQLGGAGLEPGQSLQLP